MGTLLEAIGIVLETHFEFGFPNGSPIGDSLRHMKLCTSPGKKVVAFLKGCLPKSAFLLHS